MAKMRKKTPEAAELEQLGVTRWPIWTKEVSTFPYHYDTGETCYLLEGRVIVTDGANERMEFGKGDLVTFDQGLSCTWQILEPVRKHYKFE